MTKAFQLWEAHWVRDGISPSHCSAAPADPTFEMASRPLQLPAMFDLAKGI